MILVVLGTTSLLWCVRDFYVAGKGTLAPWAPPQELVVVGLYRHSRNPMYVAVALILLGWAAAFLSYGLFVYALAVMAAFHLRVVFGEEPWLARTHGFAWQQYTRRVRRWL
ncbi:MAG TPA: isoprenylcysteine carboxylmethyltransferase family protein [Rhodanobacteraceae bacterium]